MICAFCGSRNGEGEHRCRRCGRRPDDTLTGDYILHRTEGQLAVQMQPVRVPAEQAPNRMNFRRAVQVPLFQDRPAPNVIPFEAYAPVEPLPKPRPRSTRPPRRPPRVPEEQGALDFLPAAPLKPRTLPTTVEAQIYCDAPVAVRLHRAVAAGLDASMVMIAYSLFLAVYYLCGGGFVLERNCVAMLGGVLPLLGMVYGLTWCWAGWESPGLQWTGLRLLTFEGFPADRKQRLWRFAGSCLSLFSLLGLAWSMLDEESLGWQDHISRTFPTPIALDAQVLRRL